MVLGIHNPLVEIPDTSRGEYDVLKEAYIWGEILSSDFSNRIDTIHKLMRKGLLKPIRSQSVGYNKYTLTPHGKKVIKILYNDEVKSRKKYKNWGDE